MVVLSEGVEMHFSLDAEELESLIDYLENVKRHIDKFNKEAQVRAKETQ